MLLSYMTTWLLDVGGLLKWKSRDDCIPEVIGFPRCQRPVMSDDRSRMIEKVFIHDGISFVIFGPSEFSFRDIESL